MTISNSRDSAGARRADHVRKVVDADREWPPGSALRPHEGRRALAVDDDVVCQAFLQAILEDMGFCVDVAANGADAVRRCREAAYDVVLMDIDMPLLDGIEAVHRIRAHEAASRRVEPTPIAMVSARDDEAAFRESFDAGAQAYLVKPVTMLALQRQVGALIPTNDAAQGG